MRPRPPLASEAAGRRRWALAGLAYMAALFALSAIPDHGSGPGHRVMFLPPDLHNLLHLPAYLGLAWLWARCFLAGGRGLVAAWALGALVATAYGVLDEWHQFYVPGREASVTDMLMNAAGAALAFPLLRRWPGATRG